MNLTVLRPITIKARVTEGLKARMSAELKAGAAVLDDELKQIEFQVKRAQLAAQLSPQQQMELRRALEMEKARRLDQKAEIDARLQEVAQLTLGSEIVQGQIQGPIDIAVGSDWDTLLQVEILLEDGRVVAIREG